MGPFMIYLLLLMPMEFFPKQLFPIPIALRGIGGLWAVWLVRHHLPAIGRPHMLLAIAFGVLAAAGWVAGQHAFNHVVTAAGVVSASVGGLARMMLVCAPAPSSAPVSAWECGEEASTLPPVRVQVILPLLNASERV